MNAPSLQLRSEIPATAARGSVVVTTIAILRFLASSRKPIGVNALARELSLPPSSCFKILKQLLAEDFVDFDPEAKLYSLGCGAIALAQGALDPSRVFTLMRPRLEELATDHGIAVGLWRLLPRSRMSLVGFVEGPGRMRIEMSIGQRLPMLVGAVGRAIAAEIRLPEDQLRAEFDQLRWQKKIGFEEYLMQVKDAMRCGYALDQDNFARGVTTVSVAIRDNPGGVSHGLSGIMFTGQYDAPKLQVIGEQLQGIKRWASTWLSAS